MSDTRAVPTTPTEWEEYLNTACATPESHAKEVNSGEFKRMTAGYVTAAVESKNKTMTDIKDQVEASVTATVLEMFKRNGVETSGRPDMRPVTEKALKAGTAYDKNAPGAALDGVWSSGGQMLQDFLTGSKAMTRAQRERMDRYEEITAAYSSIVPDKGGILVPEEVRSEILTRALEDAVVRPKAQVVPMPTGKFRWPVVDFTTEVGEVYGGMIMYWVDEGQTITETEASFAAIALTAHKLAGLASVPNELIRHISALEQWLRTNLPNAVRHFEDIGFMKGNGVKKPLGGLHADNPSLIVAGAESGQTSGITWNNVLTMFSRMLPESYGTAEWDITPDAIPEIFTMGVPVGTGGSAVMIGEGGGGAKLPQTMLGLPIRWTRKAPSALNTQGDISLVDWATYVIGDTTRLMIDASEHSSFRSDKTDFRVIEEVDGQPGLLAPITPENGGPTLSAYVQLATRS